MNNKSNSFNEVQDEIVDLFTEENGVKKGPFVDLHLQKKVDEAIASRWKSENKNQSGRMRTLGNNARKRQQ